MPAYNANAATNSPLTAIYPGDAPYLVWNVEAPTTGTASQQVALGQPYLGEPQQISVAIIFSVDPSSFAIDIQTADTDAAINYVSEPGYQQGVGSPNYNATNFTVRVELNVRAAFVRLIMTTQIGSAATCKATISR